jgi:signal transduction histidine kinase
MRPIMPRLCDAGRIGPPILLDGGALGALFPFHLTIDRSLAIRRIGPLLARLLPQCGPGDAFASRFSLREPPVGLDFAALAAAVPAAAVIASTDREGLVLTGQIAATASHGELAFLCRPAIDTPDALSRLGLSAADFPPHDLATDLLPLIERQQRALDEMMAVTAELRGARDEAVKASQIKTQFLANMSHELRTPLNAILGFSEALTAEIFGPIPERYRTYLNDIHSSGLHLQDLINDLLDLARIEAGRHELDEAPAALAGLLEETLRLVRHEAARKQIDIRFDRRRCDPVVAVADSRALKQVFLNVISNAIKFTDGGGAVAVTVTRRDEHGEAEVTVADNGIGIPAEVIPQLFEPFRQADIAITRSYGGTGLGLSICRKLIELHGGTIALDSTLGAGTRVTIRLPAHRAVDGDEDETPADA